MLLSLVMIATTLFAVPFTAKAGIPFESARELTLDKNYFVKITNKTDMGVFKFTPTETAVYSFSSSREDDADAYCEMFDETGRFIAYNDDDDDYDYEFNLTYTLYAGKTYYFTAHTYDFYEEGTSLNVSMKKTDYAVTTVTDASITFADGAVNFYTYNDKYGNIKIQYFPQDKTGNKLSLSFADGTVKSYTYNTSNRRFVNDEDASDIISAGIRSNGALVDAGYVDEESYILSFDSLDYMMPIDVPANQRVASFTYTPLDPNFSITQTDCPAGYPVITAAEIEVTYIDGSKATFSNYVDESFSYRNFYNIADTSEKYYLQVSDNCDFSKVGTASVQIAFIDKIETVNFNVTESSTQVQSVTFVPDEEIKLEQNDFYDPGDYFWNVSGTMTVTKKDSTVEVYTGTPNSGLVDSEGMTIGYYIECNYYDADGWTVGQNYYRIYIDGVVSYVPVTVVGVTSATFVPDSPIELYDTGYFNCVNWFWNVNGTITLYYSDGSQEVYTGNANSGFVTADGKSLSLSPDHYDGDSQNWTVGSDNYYNYYIGDFTCPVNVTVKHDIATVAQQDPTCTENGFEAYEYCKNCDYKTQSDVLPATGHVDENGDGTCDVCSAAFSFNVVQPIDVDTVCGGSATFATGASVDGCTYQWYLNDSKVDGATDITFTVNDLTTSNDGDSVYCVVTDSSSNEEKTSVAQIFVNHSYTDGEILKQPTCKNPGEREVECVCGNTDTVDIPPLGHNYVTVNAVPATCVSQGYTGDEVCANCGRINNEGTVIPTTAHNPVSANNAVMPTCTTPGKESDTICSVCGVTLATGVTIQATGHDFGANNQSCAICGASNPNYVAPTPIDPTPNQPTTPSQPTTQAPAANQPTTQANNTTTTATAEATTKKPKATSIKKLTKGKKSFKATWKKISGVNGYQVQYSTDKKFKKNTKTATIKKNTSSTTIKKLKANKKYYVRVRSYKNVKVGSKTVKVYSSWSKVKTVTTKK